MQEYFLKLGLPEAVAQLLARTSTHGNVSLDPDALTAVCVDLPVEKGFTSLACRHGISNSLSTHTCFRHEPILSQIKEACCLCRQKGAEETNMRQQPAALLIPHTER